MMNSTLLILLIVALLYTLLWYAVPRGRLLHEALRLPRFWLHLLRAGKRGFEEERIDYGKHPRQYMLWCTPVDNTSVRFPVITYFHGGGWRFGAPEQFRAHASLLTSLGYTVILPSYRRAPSYHYRHLREDLTQILLSIRKTMSKKGMDGQGIIIGGMSAGGNMAALAALNHDELHQAGIPAGWFRGLFLFGAPLHLEMMADTATLRNFAGPREEPMFQQASPYHYLDKPLALPTLIIHGTHDGMVEYPGTQEFARKMEEVNVERVNFVALPEGTHLDVASWFFRKGKARKAFLAWLERLST